MLVTTTPSIEGKKITKYCGVVAGEAILGANLFKDLFAGIRDLVGGRSATYEKELQRARDIALTELQQRARPWEQMRSSVSISTTRYWARAMAC